MLDNLSPPRRRLVLVAVSALVALMVVVAGLVAVRSIGGGAAAVAQEDPGPVLVVLGYGGNVASVSPIVEALRADGRDVTVVPPTRSGTGDLRNQAKRLDNTAKEAMSRTGATSVDVVGYSAGGVVARLWVRNGGGASVARRVLTLGSPHHGTDVAALAGEVAGGCPTACEELAPDSDFLRALNAGDESPAGPRWITVRSEDDQTVTPADSASLTGALDITVQQICADATTPHSDLPSDPVVLAVLSSTLGAGLPRVPTDVSC
ncbi:hypothetical protein [Aeromicrobium sp.]|uniref:lipase family alpha/beta hydrolase n=1 Tax=Aeromicrobium sp. TaxID=1871063 RepID=UPI0019CC116B|nr:hypothetical protein [Aeromicrobium sp.]MBC7630797.1 lipase [Aeromicrobium sp.]